MTYKNILHMSLQLPSTYILNILIQIETIFSYFRCFVFEIYSQPWHNAIVFVEAFFVFVWTDKHNLHFIPQLFVFLDRFFVPLGQLCRKYLTGRTPVGREVDSCQGNKQA